MDPVVGALLIAVITAISSPGWVSLYKRWQESHNPSAGWQAAVAGVNKHVDELKEEVAQLRLQVRQLEDANAVKEQKIADRDRTISEQSRAIVARDARISQLQHAWPGGAVPLPDPAFARDL